MISRYKSDCTPEYHAKICADPKLFVLETFIGIQPGIKDDPEFPDLEMRNCRLCDTTLYRAVAEEK
jgi:hypothetical protein